MGLLQVIDDAPGYAKIGLQGPQGSGKSRTAVEIACTIHKLFGSNKPIAFFDTEGGSDYLKDIVEDRTSLKPLRVKARAFSQLMHVLTECLSGASNILIVDSVTHVWRDLQDAYMERLNEHLKYPKARMDVNDIMQVKKLWYPWTDQYQTCPLHILVCGREGDKWGYEEDEDGKRELVTQGKKMKVEGEFGYESSLIISMQSEQIPDAVIRNKKKRTTEKRPRTIVNVATVLKDKFDVMNGQVIEMPTGEDFMPFLERLNPAAHRGVDLTAHTTQTLPESDGGFMREKTDRQILVEKIQGEIQNIHPAQTTDDKKGRQALMQKFFGTISWTEIEKRLPIARLGEGYAQLHGYAIERQHSSDAATESDPDGRAEAQAAFA